MLFINIELRICKDCFLLKTDTCENFQKLRFNYAPLICQNLSFHLYSFCQLDI